MIEKITELRDVYPQSIYKSCSIGPGTYGGLRVFAWGIKEDLKLRIGAYCSFGENVILQLGGEHRIDWTTTYPFSAVWPVAEHIEGHPKSRGDVTVGSDVWCGTDAIILSGVTIGDGAVIGVKTVVDRDIPPYAIAVGHPARVVKYRFDPKTIERLLAIAWWNWPRERIERALPFMLDANIERFLVAAERGEL